MLYAALDAESFAKEFGVDMKDRQGDFQCLWCGGLSSFSDWICALPEGMTIKSNFNARIYLCRPCYEGDA